MRYPLANYFQFWYLHFRETVIRAEILLSRTIYLNTILVMLSLAINILHFRAVWQIVFDPALFNCRSVEGSPYIPGPSCAHDYVVIVINTCVQLRVKLRPGTKREPQ